MFFHAGYAAGETRPGGDARPRCGDIRRQAPAASPAPGRDAEAAVTRVLAVLAFLGLIVSANTKLHAMLAGQPVTIPVLWLVFATVVLLVAIVFLVLLRLLIRDGLSLRPVKVNT